MPLACVLRTSAAMKVTELTCLHLLHCLLLLLPQSSSVAAVSERFDSLYGGCGASSAALPSLQLQEA